MRIYLLRISKKLHRTNKNALKIAQRELTLRDHSSYVKIFYSILVGCFSFYLGIGNVHAEWEEERELYIKARYELIHHKINQYSAHKSELTEYPLYLYLVYAELASSLSRLNDEKVDAFLSDYKDGPLATRLRLKWLYYLQKKDRWESFLKYYENDESTGLNCYYLRAKIRQEDFEAHLDQIRDLWLVGKSQPKQCDPLFAWYEENNYLTAEQIWERFSLAMNNNQIGLAKYLSKKLPSNEQASARIWLRTHASPKTTLLSEALLKDNHVNRQIISHGLKRLARKDLTAAYEFWLVIRENCAFGSDLNDEVERNFALRAAYRHDERATTWMYELPKDVVDESTGMWRARSAIRSLDWKLVLRGIAMLNEKEKQESEWQYWKARALAEIGLQSDANDLFEKIALERSYYGFLAADKVALPYKIENVPVQYTAGEFEAIANIPGTIRARELLLVNQNVDARREWNFTINTFNKKEYQIAAALAHQWQWHDYAIRTIAKGNYFDDLTIRFPTPFDNIVNKYSVKRKLEPAYVYGIIRRESAFNAQARSPVGASGLMQLMPATANQVSRQLKIKKPKNMTYIYQILKFNLGSAYISDMLNKFDGHRALASAAYDAGPIELTHGCPRKWNYLQMFGSIPFHLRKHVSTCVLF